MQNVVMEQRVGRLERRGHWWGLAWLVQLGFFAVIWLSTNHQGSQILA